MDLKARFSDENNYDTTTEITDVEAFAMWLGTDLALQIDKIKNLKLGVIDEWAYTASSYSTNLWQRKEAMNVDTFVHVYHGPVHYEDESGVVTSDEDWGDIQGAVRAWFTKRTEFSYQSEYRFAVTIPGSPTDQVLLIDVSEDLRQYTLAT